MRRRISLTGIIETVVLSAVVYTVMWRGGKSLDAVWAVSLLAGGLTISQSYFGEKARMRATAPLAWWSAVGLVIVTLLSFLASQTRNYGLDEVFTTTALILLLFWVVSWTANRPVFASRFLRTASIALLLACAVGVPVYIFQPVSRFVGTFFDYRFHTDYWPNAWAEFILLLWPMLLWTLFCRKGTKKIGSDALRAVILGFVLGCLLLSYSRGGMIAFGGQVAVLLALSWSRIDRTLWRRVALVSALSAVVSVATFAGLNHVRARFHAVESVTKKVTFSSDEGSSSVSERAEFWRQAVQLSLDRPALGWGPYSFRFVQPHIQKSVLATSDHPHNVFLKLLVERGIAAPLLFLILLLSVAITGVVSARSKKFTDDSRRDLILVVAVVGVIAHNLIDFNLQFMGIAVPLWCAFGIVLSRVSSGRPSLPRRLTEVLIALLLITVALNEGVLLYYSSRARHEEAAGRFPDALAWYELASPALFPRDQWLSRSVIELSLGKLNEAERDGEIALSLNRQDARVWRLLGDIALRAGGRELALSAYTRAYAFGRYNDIGITRGFVYLSAHGGKALSDRRSEVDLLLNEFGVAIMKNLHFIALSKNVEDLSSLTELMIELYPQDREAYQALSKQVIAHAAEVREQLSSRARGLLW